MKELVHPKLVRDFWNRASIYESRNGLLKETTTKCPRIGAGFIDEWEDQVGSESINITLYGVPNPPNFKAINLIPKCRFLLKLMPECVMPRKGSRDNVSKMDKFALCHLIHRIKVDLNNLVFKHLEHMILRPNMSTYPYGMFLTRIFRNKLFVPNDATFMDMAQALDKKTLSLMKIKGIPLTVSEQAADEEKDKALAESADEYEIPISEGIESFWESNKKRPETSSGETLCLY